MESGKSVRKRSPYWDNLKGILIVLTVFAHILYQLQDNSVLNGIVDAIYLFHMPAFVFVSGYFGKSEHSRSAETIFKFLFLYLIFNSLTGFIYGFSSLLQPVYSYWYLLALIVWRLTAPYLAKFREIHLILPAVALLAGFYPSIDNTFAVARIIAFYPFYMFGYQMTPEQSAERHPRKGLIALLSAGVIGWLAYQFFMYTDDALLMYSYTDSLDAFGRIGLYGIAFLMICALRNLCTDRKLRFLAMFGRNSLWIFLLHRPATLWVSELIRHQHVSVIILISILSTFLICLLFGNDRIAELLNQFADSGTDFLTGKQKDRFTIGKFAVLLVALGFTGSAIAETYQDVEPEEDLTAVSGEIIQEDIFYPVMTAEQKSEFDNAFRITFAGDLILLEDQVKRAYTDSGYDFSPVFAYAERYISTADYAIGVLEGPLAGEDAGYTSSNFDDGKELYLNFPDAFAQAVQNAGFDLVTTANNHLLDKGVSGAFRTLDILDQIGLDHTGSYRSAEEKQNQHIKLVECQDIRMAILSYTYGSNYYERSQLADGAVSYLTSVIGETSGELFEQLKANVELDFEEARSLNPDLIIVLPHLGTQFSNAPDEEQEIWFNIFKSCGADIILGDHPHVVEPVLIEQNVFTAYCPGNFANIYRENQGDTSMLIDVYIDRDSKQVIGGSIVPLYTQSPLDGNYRALPIYDILHHTELRDQLSTDDYDRARKANAVITRTVFGSEMDISSVTERYYFNESGFLRMKTTGLELTEQMKNSTLYQALEHADSVCFLGDSLTEGTKNGGCPWYEPLEEYTHAEIFNFSKGGCTISYLNQNADQIPEADLYVIAIGTNDVRYRDEAQCAMTEEAYIQEIDTLRTKLAGINPSAELIFIAPWYSTDGDPFCPLPFRSKTELNQKYTEALQIYCDQQKFGFINANAYIQNMLDRHPDSQFLLDHIHPNSGQGVILYCEAVLSNENPVH